MLSNLHTHTNFCDGKSTAEEVVLSAIDKGFVSIGFSGHGYTSFDNTYCMKDTKGYMAEIKALKERYKNKIQIYLGIEEDAFCPVDRTGFDYVIGSSHYFLIDGKHYPVDMDADCFNKCFEAFGGDVKKLAESYYGRFCEYILKYKPDIVGHFDLVTKFDELDGMGYLLNNPKHIETAEKYLRASLKSGCMFEVNTGAISRGYRTKPYPQENLLHILKKEDVRITITSDSHSADTLCFGFDEAKAILRDIGFEAVYVLCDGEFKKDFI
jgi:histidinol-phosphatase (PHP family)